MQTMTNELVERSKNDGAVDKEDAIQSIDAMITRVEGLKRKVSESTCICSQCEPLNLLALGFERECRYTHSIGDEGTPSAPLRRGRCTITNYFGVPAVVGHQIGQVARRLDVTYRKGKDCEEDYSGEGHTCEPLRRSPESSLMFHPRPLWMLTCLWTSGESNWGL